MAEARVNVLLDWRSRTAPAKTAERALENALIYRFGWTHGATDGLTLRHDNGLIFGSKRYRALVSDYRLTQEYITPYTPEENGLCERFIRSFKEECAWQHTFSSIDQARTIIAAWIERYNTRRPHQALGYRTPSDQYLHLTAQAA